MKSIGFNFTKNDFRFGVIDSSTTPVSLIEKGKITYPTGMNVSELMEWFETQLTLIIDKHRPNELAHKISLTLPNLDQIRYSCYPQAILSLIAYKKNISIKSYSTQSINATKFGLPKKADVYLHLDTVIGQHPPHWDKATKEAVLVAIFSTL